MIRRRIALLAVLAFATAGCDAEELDRLRQEVSEERARAEELEAAREQARAEVEQARSRESDARAQVRLLQAEAEKQDAALHAERDELASVRAQLAKIDPGEAEITRIELELEDVESHRDELVEWVEKELLPVAEEHDPRLVELREQTAAMAKAVEEIRGLAFKRPFMRRLIRREQVGEWMQRDLRASIPEDEARAMTAVGAKFGMLAPGTDIYALFSGFLQDAAAAFYKSETGTFYLIEGASGGANNPVIFHELVHAADDQHYDLAALSRGRKEQSDATLALNAVVEGCADYFQTRYHERRPEDYAAMIKAERAAAQKRGRSAQTELPPLYLVAMMALYPYKNGSAFLRKMGVRDVASMERVWRDLPVSTEQVLHPEKFAWDGPRDYPHAVSLPQIGPVLGEGWTEVEDGDMGELGAGLLLAHVLRPGSPRQQFALVSDGRTPGVTFQAPVAAAVGGWDGDRYAAYQREASGEVCIVWTSRWDSEKDAREFVSVYGTALGRRVTGDPVRKLTPPIRFEERGGGVSAIEREGARVVVVLGGPPDLLDALLAAGADVTIEPDERDAADAGD